jgi:hypothetical protein
MTNSTDMVKKYIQLPKGGTLEVEATPQFLSVVRAHFSIPEYQSVEDDHIRMYIWGAFKNAVDKAVKES